MLAHLQFWLQGHPNKRRPWAAIWLGNLISDIRYWAWRLTGGKWDELDAEEHQALAEEFLGISATNEVEYHDSASTSVALSSPETGRYG